MNAKDFHIHTAQQESVWLVIAKKIARDEAQRLMKHCANYHPTGGSYESVQRVEVSEAPRT